MDRMICITGPTATGKTRLAVALAQLLDGEIISCDSMQLYRGMDIGTAKVTAEEAQGIVHHMIDVAGPEEAFSVGRFCEEAGPIAEDIIARGKTAILAGGTGLYMDALVLGRSFAPFPTTGKREMLEELADTEGIGAVQMLLRQCDPEAAARLHPGDRRRIIRAVEIYLETGQSMTEHDRQTRMIPPRWDPVWIALNYADRADLYRRIDRRVDEMIENGLERELEDLMASGVPADATSLQAIGYKELICARRGEMSREEAIDRIKQLSRNYAKRQLTWLRKNPQLHWITLPSAPKFPAVYQEAVQILKEADFPCAERLFSEAATE
ncbi:MAG: tRNA (adenosine(37)-N6)-dimethylallyltransferase MiaA [Ruminococcaceae bacterium]|nr:tRNA (adenosine(37)-N6)-dimethylallyltransferase MiaA [Oscillospiraceae bacterium]